MQTATKGNERSITLAQLPPSREFDHRIELTPEAQPFRIDWSLLEQDELKKQLTELLECGFIGRKSLASI
jgi:hypothetical protein